MVALTTMDIFYVLMGGTMTLLLSVIGFLLVRSLKKNDSSLGKIDETMRSIELSLKDKTTRKEARIIALDESYKAVTEHLLARHAGNNNGG